ncbi:MAG: hypothetical protein WBR29_03045 [Gammaproteobacteria bacterium]
MTWLQKHLTKVIALLAGAQLLLTNLGDNPLVKLLGSHTEAVITLVTAILTALLTFLAPGKSMLPATPAPPAG